MKWRKASDGLPEVIGMIFIRNVETKHGGMIYVEELKRLGDLQNVEWLDESPSGEEDGCTCENSQIRWGKHEIEIGDKQGHVYSVNFQYCENCGWHGHIDWHD